VTWRLVYELISFRNSQLNLLQIEEVVAHIPVTMEACVSTVDSCVLNVNFV